MKNSVKYTVFSALVSLSLIAIQGCGDEAKDDEDESPVALLNDAQAAQVSATLHNGEIEAAQAALPKIQAESVRDFALHMVDEHSRRKAQEAQLLQQANLVAQPTPLSESLVEENRRSNEQVQSTLTGEVDVRYVDQQVRMHDQTLALIDCLILPSTQNATMVAYVNQELRPTVRTHLEQARGLRPNLEGESLTRFDAASTRQDEKRDCEEVCRSGDDALFGEEVRQHLCREVEGDSAPLTGGRF